MIKFSDLDAARQLVAQRDANAVMRLRLFNGEPLTLVVGKGDEAGAVIVAPSYLDRIRRDLLRSLDARIADDEAALRALGVEP